MKSLKNKKNVLKENDLMKGSSFMKKIFIVSMLLVSSDVFASLVLKCNFTKDETMGGGHALIVGGFMGACKDFKNNDYRIGLAGVGPGLEISINDKVFVVCPTVSKKRLERKKTVAFVAAHGSAALIKGIQGGFALNYRGGSCFLFGVNHLGFGASVKLGGMWITKKDPKPAKAEIKDECKAALPEENCSEPNFTEPH